ncbi:uncharacterized protein LOC127543516 [Antechinus flavipes]|uniref:uncharacterized protein LOC127543516 n=1 Tax=Antechinus flavipes TaxID=38775 RepID=UPI0022363224|nr:uncharacterized protein LOC127543516 [Antechinus flavipes]
MAKKHGAIPQELGQEKQKSLLKKTKNLRFRGPPHCIAPSSNNQNVQELDLEDMEGSITSRPKTEGKDTVASTSGRSLPFPDPFIRMDPFRPVSPLRHSKTTPACLGQAAAAPQKRMLDTECPTSSETGLEPSSESPQEDSSAADQDVGSFWAIKVVRTSWKRTSKVAPALLTECQPSPEVLSYPALDWAQGEGPPEASPAYAIDGVGAPRAKIHKASLDLPTECQTSPRVLSKPSCSWAQAESPRSEEASLAHALDRFNASQRMITKASLDHPTACKASRRVLSKSPFHWTEGTSPRPQQASPVCSMKAPRKGTKQIYPALATELQMSPRVLAELSFDWTKGKDPSAEEAQPAYTTEVMIALQEESPEPKTPPRALPPQEASPTCGMQELRAPAETTNLCPALPTQSHTTPRILSEPPFTQGEGGPPEEAAPAGNCLGKRSGKFLPPLTFNSTPSPTTDPEHSSQRSNENGGRHQGLFWRFLRRFSCFPNFPHN